MDSINDYCNHHTDKMRTISCLTCALFTGDVEDKGYWAGELEIDNYPYQVGAFITMLNNMGICKAESFDDKFGVYQTIAIEQKE